MTHDNLKSKLLNSLSESNTVAKLRRLVADTGFIDGEGNVFLSFEDALFKRGMSFTKRINKNVELLLIANSILEENKNE